MAEGGDRQGIVQSSIDAAMRVARESLDASSDAVKQIMEALKTASDRESSGDDRTKSAQDIVRSSLEVAQRVARESLDAGSDAAKEVQEAIKEALDSLRDRGGSGSGSGGTS